MGPKDTTVWVPDMFRQPLIELLNPKHELDRLADAMDWSPIEQSFGSHFGIATGRSALAPRLVAGLLYLQHAYDCSDEVAVNTWTETRTGSTTRARRISRPRHRSTRRA